MAMNSQLSKLHLETYKFKGLRRKQVKRAYFHDFHRNQTTPENIIMLPETSQFIMNHLNYSKLDSEGTSMKNLLDFISIKIIENLMLSKIFSIRFQHLLKLVFS